MTTHDAMVCWVWSQAALVACLGVAAAWILSRRTPGSAATAAAAATTTVLLVTFAAPVPMPALDLWPHGEDAVARPADNASVAAAEDIAPATPARESGGWDVRRALQWARSALAANRDRPQTAEEPVWSWLLICAGAGATIGLARLAAAWRYVVWLRREATPVADGGTLALFEDMARVLGVRRRVALCELTAIASPAVIGCRRLVVLLPADRTDWTGDHLRAALAHELAHVVRGDFAWRAVAGLAAALHYIHPLVHMLARRLALVQELAADRMAAAAMGDRAAYLRALSELSLRLDDSLRGRAAPLVVPTFSSGLARRIAMLRSKDGSASGGAASGGRRSPAGIVAAGAIMLVGAATMAARGEAETAPPTAEVAPRSEGLFSRTQLDPALLRRPDAGVFVVRVADMMEQPALAPVFQLYREIAGDMWRVFLDVKEAPEMHLEMIEMVAGAPTLTIKPKTPDSMGSMWFGCEDLIVRFREEIAWKPWIMANVPGVTEEREDGFEYLRLPDIKRFGLLSFCVAESDERTIVISNSVDRLRQLATADVAGHEPPAAAGWATLDGGLATIATPVLRGGELADAYRNDVQQLGEAVAGGDPGVMVMQAICLNVQQLGAGFDLDPVTNQSAVRWTLACPDQASAEKVQAVLTMGLAAAKAYLQMVRVSPPRAVYSDPESMVQTVGTPDTERLVVQWYLSLAENCTMESASRADGMVELRLEASAPFPPSIMTKYEPAVAAGGAEEEATTRR